MLLIGRAAGGKGWNGDAGPAKDGRFLVRGEHGGLLQAPFQLCSVRKNGAVGDF
jgi:hypothetical protein